MLSWRNKKIDRHKSLNRRTIISYQLKQEYESTMCRTVLRGPCFTLGDGTRNNFTPQYAGWRVGIALIPEHPLQMPSPCPMETGSQEVHFPRGL